MNLKAYYEGEERWRIKVILSGRSVCVFMTSVVYRLLHTEFSVCG